MNSSVGQLSAVVAMLQFSSNKQGTSCGINRLITIPVCSMRNICARFSLYAQDCTSSPIAQYMRKIVLLAQIVLLSQCAIYFEIYAQHFRSIVLLSSMRNICAKFAQIVLLSLCAIYAQYMRKICTRLYFCPPMRNICTRLQALLEEICHMSHICSKVGMVFTL